jgi:quinol monooxygenase YgiN
MKGPLFAVIRPLGAGELIASARHDQGGNMSVLITVTFQGDVETFQKAAAEHADELAQVSQRGRENGCLHHRFGVGDGVVVAYDEWESAEHFDRFFNNPEMRDFTVKMGASADAPPEITITEAIATADQF